MKILMLKVQRFYLAVQDGRAEGDVEYDSFEEAAASLARYDEFSRRGMYITSYWRDVP